MAVVLIAEDDEDIALILVRLFKRAGHTVWHAPDGVAAFELAEAERPDVLLTDLGMPRMDGLELTRAVRAHPVLRDTPIVMLSGQLHPGDTEPIESGVCAILLKPCPNDRLIEVVQDLAVRGAHGHSPDTTGCPSKRPVTA
ncbi:response regulator [Micromonosporaceae bacterium Da 78-11]